MEGAYGKSSQRYAKVAEEEADYGVMTAKQLNQKVEQMEQQMYQHAQNIEFEETANMRDKIKKLEEAQLGIN